MRDFPAPHPNPSEKNYIIRCQTCKSPAVRVGGFWICRNLSCERLVVR